ncbi:DNA-processing protein DprA, partial [Hydrogenimonas sp.]|uniref:DNA-processing protein DprA n=1 Tax=Hydrogenimonas sp. TaxID=2231112 RepID=UPI00262DAF3A
EGLVLSQFEPDFRATPWSFVVRNEVVVALGEVLVVAQADRESGTMRSVEFAKAMGKKIFVLPHRLGESEGTNDLLKEGAAEAIYDIETFADMFGSGEGEKDDEFLAFCRTSPSYEEAANRFGERLFEAELEGIIEIRDGRVTLL